VTKKKCGAKVQQQDVKEKKTNEMAKAFFFLAQSYAKRKK